MTVLSHVTKKENVGFIQKNWKPNRFLKTKTVTPLETVTNFSHATGVFDRQQTVLPR